MIHFCFKGKLFEVSPKKISILSIKPAKENPQNVIIKKKVTIHNVPPNIKAIKYVMNEISGLYSLYCFTINLEVFVYLEGRRVWKLITCVDFKSEMYSTLVEYDVVLVEGPKVIFFNNYKMFIFRIKEAGKNEHCKLLEVKYLSMTNSNVIGKYKLVSFDNMRSTITSTSNSSDIKRILLVDHERTIKELNVTNLDHKYNTTPANDITIPECYVKNCNYIQMWRGDYICVHNDHEVIHFHEGLIKNILKVDFLIKDIFILQTPHSITFLVIQYSKSVEIFTLHDMQTYKVYKDVVNVMVDDFLDVGNDQIFIKRRNKSNENSINFILFKSTNDIFESGNEKESLDIEMRETEEVRNKNKHFKAIKKALTLKGEEKNQQILILRENNKQKIRLIEKQKHLLDNLIRSHMKNKKFQNEKEKKEKKSKFEVKVKFKNFFCFKLPPQVIFESESKKNLNSNKMVNENEDLIKNENLNRNFEELECNGIDYIIEKVNQSYQSHKWVTDITIRFFPQKYTNKIDDNDEYKSLKSQIGKENHDIDYDFYIVPFILNKQINSKVFQKEVTKNQFVISVNTKSQIDFFQEQKLHMLLYQKIIVNKEVHIKPVFKYLGRLLPSKREQVFGIKRTLHNGLPDLSEFQFFIYKTKHFNTTVLNEICIIFEKDLKFNTIKRTDTQIAYELHSQIDSYCHISMQTIETSNNLLLILKCLNSSIAISLLQFLIKKINKAVRIIPFYIHKRVLNEMSEHIEKLLENLFELTNESELNMKKVLQNEFKYCKILEEYPFLN